VGPTSTGEEMPMADINTTPLVDVMLVLLIIFLITVPVVTQTVALDLPKVPFHPAEHHKDNVNLAVRAEADGSCGVYWNLHRVTTAELTARAVRHLESVGRSAGARMPEAHIRGDSGAPYKCIGGTIFAMQRAGFARIAFISEPRSASAAS
jgi:biopolymer transport protein ExbD